MVFKKTYQIEVEIDLNDCNNDPEWAVEDFECGDLMDFLGQLREDIEDFIHAGGKVNG